MNEIESKIDEVIKAIESAVQKLEMALGVTSPTNKNVLIKVAIKLLKG